MMSHDRKSPETHFGFRSVSFDQKEKLVQQVFSDVAFKYDIMNDLMSFGLHRFWKKRLVASIAPQPSEYLLDLAGGTGDVAVRFLQKGGNRAVICDLNSEMLQYGAKKRLDSGFIDHNIESVCANAENLPFADDVFDTCTISFGVRNFTDITQALKEVYRVLKPHGKLKCLEFSSVDNDTIKKFYEFYSFHFIPKLGELVTGNKDHYAYLVESIKMFPSAEKFATMLETVGFKLVSFEKMTFGVVAIHTGYKI